MKKQVKNIYPPWMSGKKNVNGYPMLIVHMSEGELEGLDNLQGGPSIDPNLGIREYSKLAQIIEIPEIRDLFHTVFNQIKNKGHVSPEIQESYKLAKRNSFPYQETPDEESGPIDELDNTGRFGDTKFGYVPENLIILLIEMGHKISENPTTGLLEFAFWKELLRVVGTVGGALLAGPIGAGLGNTAARAVTGSSIPNALVGGLKTGALAYGAQGLGQAAGLTAATPYSGGFFGGAPNMLASGLGSMGVGKAVAPGAAKAISAASVGMPAAAAATANALPSAPAMATSPGIMDTMAKWAPLGMMGLSYLSDQKSHKFLDKQAREERERYNREKEQLGYSPNWKPVMSKRYVENPEFYKVSKQDMKHGIFPSPFVEAPRQEYAKGGLVKSYTKGTLVKGPGKGQDDFIETSVPDGSYISDASSTSMLGDGSSEAGAKVLKEFEERVKRHAPKRLKMAVENSLAKTCKQVPVYLSNDEYKFDPLAVTLLGKGSNKTGADILRSAINNLRKHKSSNGSGLPPKAKKFTDYMNLRRA